MQRESRHAIVLSLVLLAGVFVTPASAQMGPWGWTVYGTGEYDTDEVGLVLGGVSFAPKKLGLVPMLGVQGHFLRYDTGVGVVNNKGVQPYVGVQNNFGTGLVGARVGYQFESSSATLVAPASIATGEGIVATGQLESWGTGTELGGQALATFNFGSKTLWTRGRVDMPLVQRNPGAVRLGVEGAYLNIGETETGLDVDFETASVGPVLMWQTGRGVNLGFAVGKRFIDSDAVYFRIDLAMFPTK
jgi:hypothetical protein